MSIDCTLLVLWCLGNMLERSLHQNVVGRGLTIDAVFNLENVSYIEFNHDVKSRDKSCSWCTRSLTGQRSGGSHPCKDAPSTSGLPE